MCGSAAAVSKSAAKFTYRYNVFASRLYRELDTKLLSASATGTCYRTAYRYLAGIYYRCLDGNELPVNSAVPTIIIEYRYR
jgi:hypothetical protein